MQRVGRQRSEAGGVSRRRGAPAQPGIDGKRESPLEADA
jgi:hypothetical protein